MYKALYRKWRPADFDSVCGQEHITDILKYQVENRKTSHAYLFCGSRGTGKTSCAKILAKAVNCESPVNGNPCNKCAACRSIDAGTATDVIEMDAASNTGVDNVRDIKDEIVFSPAELKYRVYIIDEVHMMSTSAFNALLKTLEEPPEHVIFILATTELHKLPSTIISRCQRFDFKRLSSPVIVSRLKTIAKAENIDLEEDGATLIARMAAGGMRDAVSLLELCAGLHRKIDYKLVFETLGSGNRKECSDLIRAILKSDYKTIYGTVSDVVMNSRDISVFFGELLDFYRDLIIVKTTDKSKEYLELTDVEFDELSDIASLFSTEKLVYQSGIIESALSDMQKPGLSRRTVAEISLTRMCEANLSHSYDSLLARISSLEDEITKLKCRLSASTNQSNVDNSAKNDNKCQAEQRDAEKENTSSRSSHKGTAAGISSSDYTSDSACCDKNNIIKSDNQSKNSMQEIFASRDEELTYWQEAVEKISSAKPSLGGCLNSSVAYKDANARFCVVLTSPFYASMVSKGESAALIASVLSEFEGHVIPPSDIIVKAQSDIVKKDFQTELGF